MCFCARLRSVCEQRVCVFVHISKVSVPVEFVCVCASQKFLSLFVHV